MSKTKTRNAKSNYFKDSLSNDFMNPKQFWKKLKPLPIHQINIVLTKYEFQIQFYMTLYLLLKHLIIISLLFVLL